jgi:uncharacterized membrane protein
MKHLFLRFLFVLLVLLVLLVTAYAGLYLYNIGEPEFGLLGRKQVAVVANTLWYASFYTHIAAGGTALLVGWTGFIKKLRQQKLKKIHTTLGKIYIISTFISSITGIYIGFFAEGGIIAKLGFVTLGTIWFYITLLAYTAIRNRKIETHQKMMMYSYASCFTAVTLRLWLPALEIYFHDFETAYKIVAWLSWIPNLLVARLIIMKTTNGLPVQ